MNDNTLPFPDTWRDAFAFVTAYLHAQDTTVSQAVIEDALIQLAGNEPDQVAVVLTGLIECMLKQLADIHHTTPRQLWADHAAQFAPYIEGAPLV